MGQTYSQIRWYLYGQKNFTRNGFRDATANSPLTAYLETVQLAGRSFVVTGANSGLGKEVSRYLYGRGATVFMVCRSEDRAKEAAAEILSKPTGGALHIVVADVGLGSGVDSAVSSISSFGHRLDGVLVNAGALLKSRTLTEERLETTFAVHVMNGFWRLTRKISPLLSPNGRVVVVTSGGAYLEKIDDFLADPEMAKDPYNGIAQYSRCKRAQIEAVRALATVSPDNMVVACHPGWADSPGVDDSIPDFKKRVGDGFRTTWEGAWGLAALLVIDKSKLKNGAFYLDAIEVPSVLPFSGAPKSSIPPERVLQMLDSRLLRSTV